MAGDAHLGTARLHPRCRHRLKRARTSPCLSRVTMKESSARGVLHSRPAGVIADSWPTNIQERENTRFLLGLEDLAVVVDVRGDHAASDNGEDAGHVAHQLGCPPRSFSVGQGMTLLSGPI